MAEIRTVTTLRRKRDEISASVRLYERQLAQARVDLAHVTAAIRIFEALGDLAGMARYVDTHRLFKPGEPVALCKEALASGPMTTRELAQQVMKAKGLDPADIRRRWAEAGRDDAVRNACHSRRGRAKDCRGQGRGTEEIIPPDGPR